MRFKKLNLLILFIFLSGMGCQAAQQAMAPGMPANPVLGEIAGAGATGEGPAGAAGGGSSSTNDDDHGEVAAEGPGAGNVLPPSGGGATGPVADSPITIVNAPMPNTPAGQPCAPLTKATACFSNVVVEAVGSDKDRTKYRITGTLNTKDNDPPHSLAEVDYARIFLKDLDFPQPPYRSLADRSDEHGVFEVTFLAMPGHKLELAGPVCNRTAILDFETPEPATTLDFDTCASSDPTDVSTTTALPHHSHNADAAANAGKVKGARR